MLFFKIALLASLSSCAFATVFITSPTANSNLEGGKKTTITWQDSPDKPSLAEWGLSKVSIYTGNVNQQTSLQEIAASVDVSKINTIEFTPDASIGPNGKFYFVRVESLALKDSKDPKLPALAFSATFQMSNMNGKFSPAVQAQVDGQSTAPVGAPATTPPKGPSSASSTSAATTSDAAKSTGATNAIGAASATQSANDNAASHTFGASGSFNVWMGVLGGIAAGALFL
ncbi:hypothetical protein AAF712_006062 [Marasmius tenuissimus]|uniref:Yeast cell wall synthesis Kre9/Knh1-like N-terminal domain-containing protein n=1 Tax=Marasmius tenuissimus TaxID=585030 RepID=A0ABR3A2R5_9AGAR|nr:hypothetical protein PM082_007925 [Marasmius tenuissimus]